jgi:site-specific DNA-cytosine methylase
MLPVRGYGDYRDPLPNETSSAYWQRMHDYEREHGIDPRDYENPWPTPIGFNARQDPISSAGRVGPLDTDASTQVVLAEHYTHDYCHDRIYSSAGLSPALNTAQLHKFRTAMRVRRLTPRECERLMGFPDDYTLVQHRGKPAADGPRYKALGNSMAVPVMRWIGERIDIVNELKLKEQT